MINGIFGYAADGWDYIVFLFVFFMVFVFPILFVVLIGRVVDRKKQKKHESDDTVSSNQSG